MTGFAVVTGAGSGIGRATSVALAARDLSVVCVGRRPDALAETVQIIDGNNGDAVAVPADISTEEGVAAVRSAVGSSMVDALVHAAAVEVLASVADTTRKEFGMAIDTNLAGPFFLTQALLPTFGDGAGVVFVGGVSAVRGHLRNSAYAASKAGLLGLVNCLAVELSPGVRVNCICPGGTDTAMLAHVLADYTSNFSRAELERFSVVQQSKLLLGRIASPEEIAASIVYLALDATYSTGSVLYADGGYTV